MSVACGFGSSLNDIITYYAAHPSVPPDTAALKASAKYIEDGLIPIKDEIKTEVVSIGYSIALMLVFITMFVVIIFVLWVCYELKVKAYVVIIVLIILIVVAIIVYYLAVTRAATAIEKLVDNSFSSLSALATPGQAIDVFGVINNSAAVYLATLPVPIAC